jgi:hypothetical protein
VDGHDVSSDRGHMHTTVLDTSHISQKALGMLPEGGNVMPKHVGVPYIINKLKE